MVLDPSCLSLIIVTIVLILDKPVLLYQRVQLCLDYVNKVVSSCVVIVIELRPSCVASCDRGLQEHGFRRRSLVGRDDASPGHSSGLWFGLHLALRVKQLQRYRNFLMFLSRPALSVIAVGSQFTQFYRIGRPFPGWEQVYLHLENRLRQHLLGGG